ncbi:hypothetical protein BJ508DRAFT_336859 [Ascobolus immersus RN42]|uniref:Uncharacterized protein n=1 Tax=Ascobolus immersus RN42 TaxID=1160509 RepID=A0A3N4HBB6_ASCIM|nr:hypothetical protein BJ508DRAFT_336859 [Ascobolus immersus RN42]
MVKGSTMKSTLRKSKDTKAPKPKQTKSKSSTRKGNSKTPAPDPDPNADNDSNDEEQEATSDEREDDKDPNESVPFQFDIKKLRKRYGGGRGSANYHRYLAYCKRHSTHWCNRVSAAELNSKRFQWTKRESKVVKAFCREHNYWPPAAGHPLGLTQEEMAKVFLMVVGGCDQKGPNCANYVSKLQTKFKNVAVENKGRIFPVTRDPVTHQEMEGVNVLRSPNFVRDRTFYALLRRFPTSQFDVIFKLLKHYYKDLKKDDRIVKLQINQQQPTAAQLLDNSRDFYDNDKEHPESDLPLTSDDESEIDKDCQSGDDFQSAAGSVGSSVKRAREDEEEKDIGSQEELDENAMKFELSPSPGVLGPEEGYASEHLHRQNTPPPPPLPGFSGNQEDDGGLVTRPREVLKRARQRRSSRSENAGEEFESEFPRTKKAKADHHPRSSQSNASLTYGRNPSSEIGSGVELDDDQQGQHELHGSRESPADPPSVKGQVALPTHITPERLGSSVGRPLGANMDKADLFARHNIKLPASSSDDEANAE